MNENQMQSFAAAVGQGSMSKAARSQFLTVPSLVHRINTLEAELGYRVLVQGQHGVTPTPEGERLYRAVKQALSILAEAKVAQPAPKTASQTVSIGVWWRIPPYFMKAVNRLNLAERGVYLDFVSMTFNEAPEGFDRHVIDLCVTEPSRDLDERNLRYVPLSTVEYHCVFAPSSKLAALDRITADDLRDFTVYAGADYRNMPGLATSPEVQRLFAMDNVVKESIFTKKLIQDCAQGGAVAFFPRHCGAESIEYADELAQLAHRPMAWPPASTGVYLAADAAPHVVALVEELAALIAEA